MAQAAPGAPLAHAAPVAPGYAPGLAATAVASSEAEGPLTWHKGYAEIGTPLNIRGWAGASTSDTGISSGFGAGVRVAGYYAGRSVHVGGYLSYAATDYSFSGYSGSAEAGNLSGGVALKFGGTVGSRVWMGFALDAGFNVLFKGDAFIHNVGGISIYTGYVLDVLAVGRGPFKMAITSRLGSQIEPYMSSSDYDGFVWQARLGLSIGVTFGGRSSQSPVLRTLRSGGREVGGHRHQHDDQYGAACQAQGQEAAHLPPLA